VSITSKAELASLAKFAKLQFDIKPTQTFAPLLPSTYRDGAGVELTGKPDAVCVQARSFTFIENKSCSLNNHPDKHSSWWALQQEYTLRMHDGRDKDYNFLTDYFYRTDRVFLKDNAWNQSLFKVAAMQAQFGWERYIVCFARNPSADDAKRYVEAGLVFCTDASLEKMLSVIDLAAHGVYYPFCLDARHSGYTVQVNPTPNPDYEGFSPEQIVAANRAKYEAIVAAGHAERANLQCHDYF
jgi:hypothetical protein